MVEVDVDMSLKKVRAREGGRGGFAEGDERGW